MSQLEAALAAEASSSMAAHMANADIASVRQLLEDTVSQRGRCYVGAFAVHSRFEADNTGAHKDAEAFSHLVRLFGVNTVKEIILGRNDKSPGRTLVKQLEVVSDEISKFEGRTLLIYHHAGHGRVGADGFELTSDVIGTQTFRYSNTINQSLCFPSLGFEDLLNTCDVVIVLDSCYAAAAARGSGSPGRIVELVSAAGEYQEALGNGSAYVRNQAITFTNWLANAVALMSGQGHKPMTFAEPIAKLRETSQIGRLPNYDIVTGGQPIRIPFKRDRRGNQITSSRFRDLSSNSSAGPTTANPLSMAGEHLRVVFSVYLSTTHQDASVKEIVQWLQSLDTSVGIEICGVFKTKSTTLLVEAPWVLWSCVKHHEAVKFVLEAEGSNILASFARVMPKTGSQPTPASSEEPVGENSGKGGSVSGGRGRGSSGGGQAPGSLQERKENLPFQSGAPAR